MATKEMRVVRIVCLKSVETKTGRPRVIGIKDVSGALWQRLIDAAESDPKSFTMEREEMVSEKEKSNDLLKIPLKRMFSMSRQRVMDIAAEYGIRDEGQSRSILIDQIAAERESEASTRAQLGIADDSEDGDEGEDN